MTKNAAADLSYEELNAELDRRNKERFEAEMSARKAALKPLLDLGFGDKKINELIDGIGNAMLAFADDPAFYQVLANVRLVLDGANQNIATRMRQLESPPLVS